MIDDAEMRAQTREYLMAVTVAHPELTGSKPVFDRYPKKFKAKRNDSFRAILISAASQTGVGIQVILGDSQTDNAVQARHLAMKLAFEDGYGVTEIGRRLNRDHSTVRCALIKLGLVRKGTRSAQP
jgi:chromosomal replication initiation ATPase DnaA